MRYLKSRLGRLLVAALCAAVFAITFALYGLPLQAVAYPALLCALILLAALGLDIRATRHRAKAIQSQELPEDDSPDGMAYQAWIEQLQRDMRETKAGHTSRERERLEDFTVWAHQIKTPIASMRLQLGQEDSKRSRMLEGEVTRVERYAEMALAYLRLDSESTDYVFRTVKVDQVVRQALRRFKGDFIAKRLSVSYQPTDETVVTDEKWLLFVVEQVLSNAIKYTSQGGVTIAMENGVLRISDTGIGIDASDLPRVFEKGYTGLNGHSGQQATGLGLYLCKRICGKLGHGLSASSVVGQGTSILVDLRQKTVSE